MIEPPRLTLSNAGDSIGILIGDLDGKLLLDGHDDLYGIERVQTEVGGEGRGGGQLFAKMQSYGQFILASQTYGTERKTVD